MSTYRELLQTARAMLRQRDIQDGDLDAWYLFSHVFQLKRTDYYLHSEESAPDTLCSRYKELVQKRADHIPLQQLTGIQEFMGLEFDVNEDVLIPRQDTELLVEEILKVCPGKDILDMCSGSGCIIISLAALGNTGKAIGADISEKAVLLARTNAKKLGAEVVFLQSDLFDRIEGSYDIIVSNPPYIPTEEILTLMPEVRDHEPRLALDGREDGLEFYRRIAADSKEYLKKPGYIFFEIGYNQGEAVRQILTLEGFCDITVKPDLCGLDRVVTARWL